MRDKVIFWLGNDYTHYCLAYAFQRKYGSEIYAIIEVAEKPKQFFQNQKLVKFEKSWFFHDQIKRELNDVDLEYLARFERKYKIDLWKLVQNERVFLYYNNFHKFSSKEILCILEQECRFFENVLETIKPDFFFTKISSLHHQELFYQMCKNSGVKVQILTYGVLGQHCLITQDPVKFDYVEKLDRLENKNRSLQDIQNYLHSFDLLKQLDNKIIKTSSGLLEPINAATRFFFQSDSGNTNTHYTYYGRTKFKVFFYYLIDYVKTKFRERFINRNLKKNFKSSEPFVYFPLHTEIERTLLIAAPFYINQIDVIRWIAKSLPINFKIYVKEHPAQVKRSWRSISDYKQIMNIPNVVLLHPKFSNDELYKNCSLLMTIAGTAGFEAVCHGKPVITFADVIYSLLPSVHILKDLKELPELIRKTLTQKIDPLDLDHYISLVERNVSKFDYADFIVKLGKEFFYGNNLMNVEIIESKMKVFLEQNESLLQVLADDHIRKMKWFKDRDRES
jgi:hypothetical protein